MAAPVAGLRKGIFYINSPSGDINSVQIFRISSVLGVNFKTPSSMRNRNKSNKIRTHSQISAENFDILYWKNILYISDTR